jgi:hypothetical protein
MTKAEFIDLLEQLAKQLARTRPRPRKEPEASAQWSRDVMAVGKALAAAYPVDSGVAFIKTARRAVEERPLTKKQELWLRQQLGTLDEGRRS